MIFKSILSKHRLEFNVSYQILTYETKLISKYWNTPQNVYSCNLSLCVVVCSLPMLFTIFVSVCILISYNTPSIFTNPYGSRLIFWMFIKSHLDTIEKYVLECRVCINFRSIVKRLLRILKILKFHMHASLNFRKLNSLIL